MLASRLKVSDGGKWYPELRLLAEDRTNPERKPLAVAPRT
jgi:hypothetical protein